MAELQMIAECLVCEKKFKSNEKTVVVLPATLTDVPWGQQSFYKTKIRPNCLRVKFVPTAKPSGLLCYKCIEELKIPLKRNR